VTVCAGTKVALRQCLLEPAERASLLPRDTAALPYEALIRGILIEAADVGQLASIRTAAGRVLSGRLEVVEPADDHTFGRPPAALVAADEAISALVRSLRA